MFNKTNTGSRLLRNREFVHDFWHFDPLVMTEIDGKRHYIGADGVPYPSVTTVLGARTDKSGLDKWRQRVGEEEANKILVQAGNRGTAVHACAEAYLLNEENWPEKTMPANKMTFNTIRPVLDEHIGVVHAIEAPLYSNKLYTAGRTDCIAEFDGVLSVVDFKTSRRLKEESYIQGYFIQATCYATMAEELTNQKIPQIAIIIAVDHEQPQVFVKQKEDYMDAMRTIFNGKPLYG